MGRYVIKSRYSIDTFIQCVGLQKFREMLKHCDSLLNANQQTLINEYRQINAEKLKEIHKKMPLGGLSY